MCGGGGGGAAGTEGSAGRTPVCARRYGDGRTRRALAWRSDARGRWVVGGLFKEFVEGAVGFGAAIVPDYPKDRVYQPHAWLPWFIHGIPLDPFRLAAFLERTMRAEGVEFLYETNVVGVESGRGEDASITDVVLHNKGGFFSVPVGGGRRARRVLR